MWPWPRSTLTLGVDAHWLAPADAAPPLAHGAVAGHAWHTPDGGALKAALGAVLAGRRVGTLRVLLGADLCRHWVLQVPDSLRSWADLQALAQARAVALFGAQAADAASPAWILGADWHATGAQWCAAVPSAWINGLRQAGMACGVRVQVLSAMQVAWQRLHEARVARGLLAWTTPGHLVLAQAGARGRVQAWRALRRPPGQGGALQADVAALALAEARALAAALPGIDSPDALQVLTVGEPAAAAAPQTPAAPQLPASIERTVAPWHRAGLSLAATEAAWAASVDGASAVGAPGPVRARITERLARRAVK